MATPVYTSMTDHSGLDNSGDQINGSEVDENPLGLAQILDGTSTTSLNAASTPGMNFTNLPYTLDHKIGRLKVYNDSGGALTAGQLVYISGYDSTNAVYEVTKAVVTEANATTLYAQYIVEANVANGAVGYVCKVMPLTAQDTDGLTAGRPIFLNSTAGGWTGTLPTPEHRIQIVGQVVTVSATTGRIILEPGQIIPWDQANTI